MYRTQHLNCTSTAHTSTITCACKNRNERESRWEVGNLPPVEYRERGGMALVGEGILVSGRDCGSLLCLQESTGICRVEPRI